MAILDDKRDALVVRIVYDGPPFSGKTTTLRALSSDLARPLDSPEEHEGRTLYFDWLDYTAGRFEGRPIRCQVVSVPGQKALSERRRKLLSTADSAVFVADTGSIGMELSLKYARDLAGYIGKMDDPRPGVVVQANKRDVEDALPLERVISDFHSAGLDAAIIETTATDGAGVRESFLFGVRLALDRVRDLSARGLLRSGRPRIDSPDELLQELASKTKHDSRGQEPAVWTASPISEKPATASHVASRLFNEALRKESDQAFADRKLGENLPDPGVPSGFIWPSIGGRVFVQQAMVGGRLKRKQLPSGDFFAYSRNGWNIHSRRQDLFDDEHEGRAALVEWARLHVRNSDTISARRAIVLTPEDDGFRLWQIVASMRSLDTFLTTDSFHADCRRAAECLLVAIRKLDAAWQLFAGASMKLPFRLTTISSDSSEPRYVGLLPGADTEAPDAIQHGNDRQLAIAKCLGPVIRRYVDRFERDQLLFELKGLSGRLPNEDRRTDILVRLIDNSQAA